MIGITTNHRIHADRPRFHLPTSYVDAVRIAGAVPVLLPPGEQEPEEILQGLDGLVLSGGGDVHPENFGGSPHPDSYSMCRERDAFEVALVRAALADELPTLAICRGMQVLNVARGGDLHAHVPDVLGDAVPHRRSRAEHTHHGVVLEAGCGLAEVYRRAQLTIASWHHQAVDRLGEGLRPVAWAEDGAVEALELPGADWMLAVQWHPELQMEPGSPQRDLFAALVALARHMA